jgi:hypothetical protein
MSSGQESSPPPTTRSAVIAGLASEHFQARRDASNELQPSLETCRRIEFLLAKLNNAEGGDAVRAVRAVEILEALGTPAAYAHLETLAKGALGHRLTLAAKEALRRRSKAV